MLSFTVPKAKLVSIDPIPPSKFAAQLIETRKVA